MNARTSTTEARLSVLCSCHWFLFQVKNLGANLKIETRMEENSEVISRLQTSEVIHATDFGTRRCLQQTAQGQLWRIYVLGVRLQYVS